MSECETCPRCRLTPLLPLRAARCDEFVPVMKTVPHSMSQTGGLILARTAVAWRGRERAPRHGPRPRLALPTIGFALTDWETAAF